MPLPNILEFHTWIKTWGEFLSKSNSMMYYVHVQLTENMPLWAWEMRGYSVPLSVGPIIPFRLWIKIRKLHSIQHIIRDPHPLKFSFFVRI